MHHTAYRSQARFVSPQARVLHEKRMVPAGEGSLRTRRLLRLAAVCLLAGAFQAEAGDRRPAGARSSPRETATRATDPATHLREAATRATEPIAAARRLRERAHTLAPLAITTTGITRDAGPLAIIEHDGSDYSRLDPDGTPNYAARARVTRTFYEDHGDRYDFVVVFTNFPFDTAGAIGFHNLVRNDVSGVGLPPINNGPLFGSPGRLKGYVDMGPIEQFRVPPFSTQPGDPAFRDAVDVIAHEVGHQWLARPRYRTGAGDFSSDLLGLDDSHWSYLLDSDASLFYGSDWLPTGEGVFRASRVQQGYSSLDLYLMGLLDPARVQPFTLLRNPAVSPDQLPVEGATVTATPEVVGVTQVVAAEGARQPDHRASQKDFRIGFVVLAGPGLDPTAEDLDAVNRLREAFAARFFALTRGVAFADTTLEEEPLPPPAANADLDRALAWLRTRQALDGRWEDAPGTALRDTAAVLDALDASGDASSTYAHGQSWMLAAVAPNLDFAARRARALALETLTPAAREALIAAVLAHRNSDGGFGAASGYESDGFDTALALRALRDLGVPADARVRGALAALASQQLAEGGWALVPGRGASTMATAQVLLALLDWNELPESSALLPAALASLAGRQNDDGGFGESPSTAHGTALALLALDRAGAPALVVDRATSWLQRTQLVEGSWNGRAYETALSIAALKGRTAPNLVVRQDDFLLEPALAEEGQVVQATVRVRNVGRLAAPASTIRLYDGAPIEANAIDMASLPVIEPGGDALVVLEYPTADRPGTRLVSVAADADAVVSEVREDDNTASRSLEVEGPMADLEIRASDIVVEPYPPEAGETVQVTVTVTNRGNREAPPTLVRLFRGHPGSGGGGIGFSMLPMLAAGSSVTVTLDWLASGPPGTVQLVAVADAAFALVEADETNNLAALPVRITGPVGPGSDLEVPLVEVDPSTLSTLPQTVATRIVVRNLGRDPVSSTIALFDGSPATGPLVAEQPVALGPRSATLVTIPFEMTSSGSRTLTAIADRASTVDETDEGNNQASARITDPRNTLDVAVTGVMPLAADLVIGETLSVTATIRNRGTLPVAEVPVILARVEGGLAELDRARVTLVPGAATTVTLTWVTSVMGDAVPFAVVVDPFDLLLEMDESNNRRDFAVQVRPSALANLHVSGADVSFDPDPPMEGGSATIRARVTNTSAVGTGAFVVRFHLGDPAAGGSLLGEVPRSGLEGQGQAVAEIVWAPVNVSGAQGVFVVVDAAAQVEEYDETDNVGFRPFQVIGLADLSVSSAELTLEPAFPRAGEPVIVRAVVRNLGPRSAPASTLRVFEGEPSSGVVVAESGLPALAPGQSMPVSLSWTPAGEGERLLTALADADQVVPESSEGNNLGRREVVIQDADFFTTAPYFSPDGDGVQDETVLAYRATDIVTIQVSDARGHLVRVLAEAAPPQGTVSWDGRDDRGRLLWDGLYALTLRSRSGAILGRLDVVLDTNRSPIHDAAGTGFVAVRTIDASQTNARGPAWMPSEDEVLLIIPVDHSTGGLLRGLLRWRLDGGRVYVVQDEWYDLQVQFASANPVSSDGREVLVTRQGGLFAVDLQTGTRRPIAPGSRASWSPDASRILVENVIYARDGTLVATLPFGGAVWSPDGQELVSELELIRSDGTDPRTIPLPIPLPDTSHPGEPCFAGSFWRGDGRIALKLGHWVVHDTESWSTSCDPDRVFAYDPATGESSEALGLRGVPISDQWSPDGSRLLHPARTGEGREVTHEAGGPSLQIWPTAAWATPRAAAAYSCDFQQSCNGFGMLSVVTNLLNLTADLSPTPLPGNNGVLLKGTATDANLDRWQVDYTLTSNPTEWHPIGAASAAPVVDALLSTWVPSQAGTYLLRLAVWDRAGGQRTVSRVVSWAQTPALANITQTERLISPNDDGIKDGVRFDFLVQEPTRLEARVVGPEPIAGTPGQAPIVRRFSLDLPAIGPAVLVWDGRDATGQRVPDGRYTVLLNEVPFQVDVDATPPELAFRHDNLRVVSQASMSSPGEVVGPTGECVGIGVQVLAPGLDRHWHIVDPNLKGWSHGAFEWGSGQVYEPERNADGQIVYVNGVPKVLRQDGRPVDRLDLTVDPRWPGTLEAVDLGGNVSSLASAGIPTRLFVMGLRPQPRCLPPGSALPPTRYLEGVVVKVSPKTRFFVKGAPGNGPLKRFEYRTSEADPWSAGPSSTLEQEDIVDVDLATLGLLPGRTYRGRFATVPSPEATSDEFLFKLCTESIDIRVDEPEPIPGTGQSRYAVTLEADVAEPLAVPLLDLVGSGGLQGFVLQAPFERTGPTTYRKVVVAPTAGCSTSGAPSILEFRARVHRLSGAPIPHDGACLNLIARVGRCTNTLVITEERLSCDVGSSDQVVMKVQAQSTDPTAAVTLERMEDGGGSVAVGERYAIGAEEICGAVPGPSGQMPLYCDQRLVTASVADVPDGVARFVGRLEPDSPAPPPAPPLASGQTEIRVDHTSPGITLFEPPAGGSACVERNGLVENVRLALRVQEVAATVAVTDASYRYGDGPWRRMCLDGDCGPWGDLPTGSTVERLWDVRGLLDGAYEIRLEVCDRSGNRLAWTERVSIARGGTAIDVTSGAHPDFSPNGDGRADETRVDVRLPQTLRLAVEVLAGGPTGNVVRRLADQQLPAGTHEFVWDGRMDTTLTAPDGRYLVSATGTNACHGTAGGSAWVRLDTAVPIVEIASPASGAILNTTTNVVGRAHDSTFESYALSFGAGASPTAWTPIGSATHPVGAGTLPGVLGLFQPPLAEGSYTLRLLAWDRAQNEAETRTLVNVAARAFLDHLAVTPDVFSPNGDGRLEAATIEYELLVSGRVTLEIQDGGGAHLRQLETAVQHEPGLYIQSWDGTRDDGSPAPEGIHRVFIRVADPAGVAPPQEQTLSLAVDRTTPTVLMAHPLPTAFVSSEDRIRGTVADPMLREYVITAERPFTPSVEIARGTQEQLDADLGSLAGLSDGPCQIVVTAEDRGANRTEVRVPITLDTLSPQALIQAPAPGAVVKRDGPPVAVLGTALDAHLESFELAFGAGVVPGDFIPIATGTHAVTGGLLGTWSVAGVADGPYVLRLVVRDRTGRSVESRSSIVLDGQAPDAAIQAPGADAAINAPATVLGTASDANLESWRLEAAPGEAATAYQWSVLAEFETPVAGPLAEWAPLPPDGRHTLRLTVSDRAGHQAVVTRTVTVDTTSPAVPAEIASRVVRDGPAADIELTWAPNLEADLAGYVLTRNGVAVTSSPLDVARFTDEDRSEGVYVYELRAVDMAGNASPPRSHTVRVDLTPPTVSLQLPAAGSGVAGSVEVRGTAFSLDDFAEYRVLSGEGPAPTVWTLVRRSTVPVSVGLLATWIPTHAGPHILALEAEDRAGNQARTTVLVTVDHTPPSAPMLLSVDNLVQPTTLTCTWQIVPEPDLSGYLVYRNGRIANAPGIVIGDLRPYLVPGPAFADTALPDGPHCYRVVAMDQAGNLSPPSNEICVTLDNRPPHATLTSPPDGTRFEFPLRLIAETPDLDVAYVRFEATPAAQSTWTLISPPDTQRPFEATLAPVTLAPGGYRVRAVAGEAGGEEDPTPSPIMVIYGDASAPAPPAGLGASAEASVASLTWSPSAEPDLAGYHVYRDGVRLTPVPQASTTFTEELELGSYAYEVTAIDADGNESQPSATEATIYRLRLDAVVPGVTNGPVTLTGIGARWPSGTIEIVRSGATVAMGSSGPSGSFTVTGVPLAPGPNLLTARERDASGHASVPSEDVAAISNEPPGPIEGLTSSIAGLQVSLAWDAATDSEVFGYHVRRDGDDRIPVVPVTYPVQVSASSSLESYGPFDAFDGDPESSWIPRTVDEASDWTITWPQTVLVSGVDLDFADVAGPVTAPAYRIEADWDGRFLPLLGSAGGPQSHVSHTLALPFATRRLRVALGPATYVGLAEVSIRYRDVVPAQAHAFVETVADGVHTYEVTAVDRFGAVGAAATAQVSVGDVDPPPVPQGLQASVSGSNVTLSWQPVTAPDLAGYVVRRDGAGVGTSSIPLHVDAARPNGTYTYSVRARDAVGNESPDSEAALAVVGASAPPPPVLAGSASAAGSVLLSWTHPGAVTFQVLRATSSGGPYEVAAETGDIRAYADIGVRPGAAYFYVVRARDGGGNASEPSNEVTVTPVAPRPLILRPTLAGQPVTVRAPLAGFAGHAWPEALVALTVNGELRGLADAGHAYEESEALSLPADAFAARIAPDGRTVSFATTVNNEGRARWMEWATGHLDGLAVASQPTAFSADGRRLAYRVPICDPVTCQADLTAIDLDSQAVSNLEAGPLDVQDAAWSPLGDRLAVIAWDSQTLERQLTVIDVPSGASTVLAQYAGGVGSPRWSPSGEEIAVLRWDGAFPQPTLDAVRVADGTTRTLPGIAGWTPPVWKPAGRTIVYTSVATDHPRLRSWDLDSDEITDLTSGEHSAVDPRIDPTGMWLSYVRYEDGAPVRHALVARNLATGSEREVLDWTSDYPSTTDVHEWVRGGYLAFLLEGRIRLFPSFDGAFHVPSVALEPGVNQVEAEGIEVSTGAVSPASDAVEVTVPIALFADLSVSASELRSYPTIPTVGQLTVLSARVRNIGAASAAASEIRLRLRGSAGVLVESSATVGPLEPGGSALVSMQWMPLVPGTFLLQAEVDPGQQVVEGREDNNVAESGVFVVDSGGLTVQLAADRSAYPANTPVLLTIEVVNGGSPFTGRLITRVVTATGVAVATLDERTLVIPYGETERIDVAWNTGATLAGDYTFEVQAFENETVRAEVRRAFRIDPDVAIWTRVVPDDPTVALGAGAILRMRVENRGANTGLAGAAARLQVAPDSAGTPVFTTSAPIPTLGPGAGWDVAFVWAAAAPAGVFVVRAEVTNGVGSVLATGTAPLEVRAPAGVILTGTLALAPANVLRGGVSRATARLANPGPTPVVQQSFALEVVNGPEPIVLLRVPFVLDVPAGETRQADVDLPTASLPAGAYPVLLRSEGSTASLDRATLHVHSFITPPSVDSPPSGGIVATDHPQLRVNNASAAGEPLTYEFALYRDEALTLALPGASGIPEAPDRTSWLVQVPLSENERHYWRARATDGFSNSAWTAVASFLVDAVNEPPTAPTPDSPGPEANVATLQPALVVANAFDAELDPLTYDFRVATDAGMTEIVAATVGVPEGPLRTSWSVPVELVANARYFWNVRAHDGLGSSAWTVPIAFRVDVANHSPTAVPLLRPEDDAEVAVLWPELATGPASDPEGDPLVYRIEVDRVPTFDSAHKQVSPDLFIAGGEATWTPPDPLLDNARAYWRAAAFDGHTAGPWSYRGFFVNLANDPPGAPVALEPGSGSVVTTQTPVLRVQNAVDLDQDALTYSFEIHEAGGGLVVSVAGVVQAPTHTSWPVAGPLAENGAFTWRSRAHDGLAFGPWSADTPFRVNSTNDPPSAPALIAPAEGAIVSLARPDLVVANASSPDLLPLSYGFELYRPDGAGGLTLVDSVDGVAPGASQTSWAPGVDLPNGDYSWRARAADMHQPGPWMSSAHFTVSVDVAPAAPTGLTAIAGDARVDLTWNVHPEPDVVGYRVYRAASAGGPYGFVGPSSTPQFEETGLPNGETVYYAVTAIDSAFESDRSLEVAATPTAGPLAAGVAFWPAVVDGECLECPAPARNGMGRDEMAGLLPIAPFLECVRNDGPLGFTAFFGFDNPNAAAAPLPIGPANFFDPKPIDRGQPSLFARGRSPEYPGRFRVTLDGEPLTWSLDGESVTASALLAVKNCALPPLACPQWLYATIEPAEGHDANLIDPGTVRLGGLVAADPTYQALVDRDGDGLMEREVRFARSEARPLLAPGDVPLGVNGLLGTQTFAGGGELSLAPPKARLEAWPTVLSRSQPGPDIRAWISLRGCFAGSAIDVSSIRLAGTVRVSTVLGIEGDVLMVAFSRSAVMGVLPLGDRVEMVVTGSARGQAFRAVDLVRVVE